MNKKRKARLLAKRGGRPPACLQPMDPVAYRDLILAIARVWARGCVTDRAQAWVTSRRAGKSRGAVYRGLMSASETPDVNVLYLSTSIKRAVNTLWDLVLRTNRDAGLGGVPNHTRHCLRLPNGSQFWVSGCR